MGQFDPKKDWVSTTQVDACRSTTTTDDGLELLTCALDDGHEDRSKHLRMHKGHLYRW